MKILVVEDEVFGRMKLQMISEKLGECEAVGSEGSCEIHRSKEQ